MRRCPLCSKDDAVIVDRDEELGKVTWKCPWCYSFVLRLPFSKDGLLPKAAVPILRGLSVERGLRNEPPLTITHDNIEDLVIQGPRNPVEQSERLLLNLSHKSSEPTIPTSLTSFGHRGMAFASATDAFVNWLTFLQAEGLILLDGKRQDQANDLSFRLTLAGWRRVGELETQGKSATGAFVAMPFKPEFDELWSSGIKPAIEATGWQAVRADKTEHNQRIDDWIMNQIQASRFVIVESTGSNPGACFEAGYALGLRKPVLWVAQKSSLKEGLHFDIRQYNHLAWTEGDESDLGGRLQERILNTVGQGPGKPSGPNR